MGVENEKLYVRLDHVEELVKLLDKKSDTWDITQAMKYDRKATKTMEWLRNNAKTAKDLK